MYSAQPLGAGGDRRVSRHVLLTLVTGERYAVFLPAALPVRITSTTLQVESHVSGWVRAAAVPPPAVDPTALCTLARHAGAVVVGASHASTSHTTSHTTSSTSSRRASDAGVPGQLSAKPSAALWATLMATRLAPLSATLSAILSAAVLATQKAKPMAMPWVTPWAMR